MFPTKLLGLAVVSFLCSFSLVGQDLDFQTSLPNYTAGDADGHSYVNLGNPATDVEIAVTGDKNFISTFGTPTPRPVSSGLSLQMNWSANSQCVTFTFTFAAGVSNLSFNMVEIDRGGATSSEPGKFQYQDQVTISGMLGTTPVDPLLGTATGTSISGNTITGTAATSGVINTVSFQNPVTQVTIQYCNGPDSRADPTSQGISIGDMSWDGPLPVVLTRFEGRPSENLITLNWQTSEEKNSQHFDVQRSQDAQQFSTIGTVAARGMSPALLDYTFTDSNPSSGTNYYRLRMMDVDETEAFSRIIAVSTASDNEAIYTIQSNFNELIVETQAENPAFELYTLSGRRIHFTLSRSDSRTYRLSLPPGTTEPLIFRLLTPQKAFSNKLILTD
ncbi:hypothetical protein [Arundinibacter roseus]|uniref:Uncharacterized protein n=1 Tax=Arundinibacter roseus TaxID=2070510 RepID=A0A4R4K764_9BACT|nr:hypothetical protein [Arundinibacter roseus]TDB63397.1 hypothetical protein EZE20_16660 [Arundinibacter roseus]